MDNKNIYEMVDQIKRRIEAERLKVQADAEKESYAISKTILGGESMGLTIALIIIEQEMASHQFENDRQIALDLIFGGALNEK